MNALVHAVRSESLRVLSFYRNLPGTVHLLCAGSLVNRAGSFITVFLAMYVSRQLQLGDAFAANCIGVLGLGAVVSSLIGGQLADQFGRRATMLLALFGGAVLLLVMAQVRSAAGFAMVMFLFAMVMEMYRPASSAMIGDVVAPEHRAHAYGLMYISVNLGFAIAPPLGGWLITAFSWDVLFWGDALTTAAYGLVVLLFVRETRHRPLNHPPDPETPAPIRGLEDFPVDNDPRLVSEHAAATASRQPAGPQNSASGTQSTPPDVGLTDAARMILSDVPFLAYCICNLLTAMVFVQCFSTLPLYMKSLQYSEAEYGQLIFINGALIVLLQLPLSHALSRCNRVAVILLGELFLACGFGLTTFATTTPMLIGSIVIWTLGEVIQAPFKQAIVADLAPPAVRARYMGVFGMSFSVAMMIGAPVGGLIFEHYGPLVLWPACFATVLCAMLIYVLAWRGLTRRLAARR